MAVRSVSAAGARTARLLVVLALVVISAPFLGTASASAATVGGFEIDGDLTASGALDWSNVGGQPVARDRVSSSSDDGFKSGNSAKEENPDAWDTVTAKVTPDANDIGDIYSLGRLVNSHQWGFVGFERSRSGGSTAFNVELNQLGNKINGNGLSVPNRTNGDILIDVTQSGSGAVTVGGVYSWTGSTWALSPGAANAVSGASNSGPVTDVDGNTLAAGTFAEIGIDVTAAFSARPACPGQDVTAVNIRSRSSSSSVTSDLKDYVKPGSITMPNNCGRLTIQKQDPAGALLPGAAFTVAPNPSTGTGSLTVTDGGANDPDGTANGVIDFTKAIPGSYVVTETAAPKGYLLTAAAQNATVTTGNQTVKQFTNGLGSASWTKVDETGGAKVGGATYTLTATSGDAQALLSGPITVVDNGTRDTDPAAGAVTVTGLYTGTYSVRETVPPAGYALPTSGNPKSVTVSVATPNPSTSAFTDPRLKGSIVVNKTDAVSGTALDATFRLYRDNGDGAFSTATDTPIGSATQSSNGTLTFADLTWGKYWVQETVPPTGYLVDPDLPRLVTVDATHLDPTVAVADPRKPSTLTVRKVDAADGSVLEGAKLKLWKDTDATPGPSAGDTAAGTCTTGANGLCSIDQLGFGAFYWEETVAPADYLLPADPYSSRVVINAANAGTTLPVREFRDIEIDLETTLVKDGVLGDSVGDGGDGDHLADKGEVVTYTFTLTNAGNAPLTDVVVNDPKVGAVSCPSAPVAPGGTATCTATYTVTQADIDSGSVHNVATATAKGPNGATVGSNEASHTLPVDESSAVTLDKGAHLQDGDGDGLADLGETIRFTFTVTNTGNDTLHGATVTDPKAGAVTCPAGSFGPGQSVTCTRDYVVTQDDVDNGSVTNVATAAAIDTDGSVISSQPDDTVTPTDQVTAIRLEKSGVLADQDGDARADVGELVTWTFVVVNEGRVTLHGVTVSDPKAGPVSCPVTSVAPGKSVTCTATYAVTQADIDSGSVHNVATASGAPTGRDPITSEPAEATLPVDAHAALSIVKTGKLVDEDGDDLADKGETVEYSFVVTNDGTTTLHGISVDDPRVDSVDCPAGSLLPGKSVTCTASYVVTQADVDAGEVVNTATATGIDPDDDPVDSDPSTETVDTDARAALAIDKTAHLVDADGDDRADAGETVAYAFEVTNTGTTTLHGTAVTDPMLDGAGVTVDCPAGSLLPGKSVSCTASYVVTQADVDRGTLRNVAAATAIDPDDEDVTSAPDEAVVPVDTHAAVELAKKGTLLDEDGDHLADVDETVTYAFTVTNDGNVTLDTIAVDDPKLGTVDCPAGPLAPGKSMTCTASYVVTQADVDHGSVDNVATATAVPVTETEPIRSDEATASVPADHRSALAVRKTAQLVDSVDAGGDADGLADAGRDHRLHLRGHQHRHHDPVRRAGRRPDAGRGRQRRDLPGRRPAAREVGDLHGVVHRDPGRRRQGRRPQRRHRLGRAAGRPAGRQRTRRRRGPGRRRRRAQPGQDRRARRRRRRRPGRRRRDRGVLLRGHQHRPRDALRRLRRRPEARLRGLPVRCAAAREVGHLHRVVRRHPGGRGLRLCRQHRHRARRAARWCRRDLERVHRDPARRRRRRPRPGQGRDAGRPGRRRQGRRRRDRGLRVHAHQRRQRHALRRRDSRPEAGGGPGHGHVPVRLAAAG